MPKVRYQPLGPLLSGKGSRAFLALEIPEDAPRQSRPVVMIWLSEELASDPASLASVERETNRAVVLDHPNIIRVYGLVRETQGVARVVEFADGESLRRVLEVAPRLPVGIAARVIVDAAMGVHYAHMAGNDDGSPMVHGDLRPETLLVTYGGVSKVSGYGALAVAPKEPGGRRVRGRRQHCAPEQVVGGRDAVNVQTDVYLLGVALYECITGKVPFQDASNFDEAVLNDPPPSLSADECPPALAEVIHRAMSKKAIERYPSALALREAIEQAMGELPSHASFANYLKNFFPEMEPARTARKLMLDEAVEKLGGVEPPPPPLEAFASSPGLPALKPSAPPAPVAAPSAAAPAAPAPVPAAASTVAPAPAVTKAAPAVASVPPPPAPAAPAPAIPAPAAALPPPAPLFASSAPPPSSGSRSGLYVVVGIALISMLASVGIVFSLQARTPPIEPLPPVPSLYDAGIPSAEDAGFAEAADGGTDGGSDDAGTLGEGLALGADGGTLGADAGEGPGLTLFVDPAVDVTDLTLENKALGRTPFTVALPSGKHVLRLVDRSKGIDTVRGVTVPDAGFVSASFYLSRGYVAVTAPDGAEIFIDGRSYGRAPQKEIGVYEGNHRIVVTVGKARWQEAFDIKPNERLKFTVAFETHEEE